MKKKHLMPEFQVICMEEADAKFFVASGFQSQPCTNDGQQGETATPPSTGAGWDNSSCVSDTEDEITF